MQHVGRTLLLKKVGAPVKEKDPRALLPDTQHRTTVELRNVNWLQHRETNWVWRVYECVLVQFAATFPYQSSCLLRLSPVHSQTDEHGEEWKSTLLCVQINQSVVHSSKWLDINNQICCPLKPLLWGINTSRCSHGCYATIRLRWSWQYAWNAEIKILNFGCECQCVLG